MLPHQWNVSVWARIHRRDMRHPTVPWRILRPYVWEEVSVPSPEYPQVLWSSVQTYFLLLKFQNLRCFYSREHTLWSVRLAQLLAAVLFFLSLSSVFGKPAVGAALLTTNRAKSPPVKVMLPECTIYIFSQALDHHGNTCLTYNLVWRRLYIEINIWISYIKHHPIISSFPDNV